MDAGQSLKLTIFSAVFQNLERSQSVFEHKDDHYDWVPFNPSCFVDMLLEAYFHFANPQGKLSQKFLEVGCGMGTKTMLADILFDACGFDINDEYLSLARRLGCQNVFKADALVFDRYHEFDLIYFYGPFKNEEKQAQFERLVAEKMKVGALVGAMRSVLCWDDMPGMERKTGFDCSGFVVSDSKYGYNLYVKAK